MTVGVDLTPMIFVVLFPQSRPGVGLEIVVEPEDNTGEDVRGWSVCNLYVRHTHIHRRGAYWPFRPSGLIRLATCLGGFSRALEQLTGVPFCLPRPGICGCWAAV